MGEEDDDDDDDDDNDNDNDGGRNADAELNGSSGEAGGDHVKTSSRDDLANQLRQCAELHDLLDDSGKKNECLETEQKIQEDVPDPLPVATLSARCEQLRAQLKDEMGSIAVFMKAHKYLHAVMEGEEMEDPSVSDFYEVLINGSDGMPKSMSRDETEDLLAEMILLLHLEGALLKARRPRE
jgi:hypothetical protein